MNDIKKTKKQLIDELTNTRVKLEVLSIQAEQNKKVDMTAKESSENLYYNLFEAANDAIFIMKDYKFVMCNPKTLEMFGCSTDQIIGYSPYDFSPSTQPDGSDSKEKARRLIETALSGKKLFFEWQHSKFDGTLFDAEVSLNRVELNSGPHLHAIVRDVTERKQFEGKIRASEERLSSFINAASDSFYHLDSNMNFIDINQIGLKLVGKSREEVLGKHITEIVPDVKSSGRYEKHLEVMRTGQPFVIDHFVPHPVFGDRHFILRSFKVGDGLGVIATDITERKKLELALKKSEEQNRLVIENLPSVIWVSNEKGETTYISPNIEKVYGFKPEEIYNKGKQLWFDRINPDDVKMVQERIKGLIQNNEKYDVEYRIKRKDGRWIWLRDRANLCQEVDGKRYAFGIFSDITDRKNAEDALRESEIRFRTVIEQASDAFFLSTTDGQIVDVNFQACESLGYSFEELLSMNIADIDVEVITGNHKKRFWDKLEKSKSITFEGRQKRKDGSLFPVEISLGQLDLGGKTFMLGLARDITERKQAEEMLKESEQNLKEAQAIAHIGHLKLNPIAKEMFGSDELFRIYGLNKDEATYKSFSDVVHPEDQEHGMKQLRKAMDHGIPWDIEHRLICKDGTEKWVHAVGQAIKDETGKVVNLIGTVQDISERKKAEKALAKAMRELEAYKNRLHEENVYLREEIKLEHNFEQIIGSSKPLRKVFHEIELAAKVDSTVLILGETGTGKELVARAIHNLGKRKDVPLVKVNCAALPTHLIESELFGHEKGAFTGAVAMRKGRFELAHKGSIFLDEISELSLELQSKLLRIIQEGEFERVGSEKTIKVDVRIIAATNRVLKQLVLDNKFRRDLYFRLNVFPIEVPPLRERREDIPLLVNHFARKFGVKSGKKFETISKETIDTLKNLDWPGNVRELENIIERAVIFCSGPILEIDRTALLSLKIDEHDVELGSLETMERRYLKQVLEITNWTVEGKKGAAKILDLHPNTLRSKMKKLQIQKPAN